MNKRAAVVALVLLASGVAATGYAQWVDRETLLIHYQAPIFVQFSDQTYLLGGTSVENGETQRRKPSLNGGKITAELSGGLAGGCGGCLFYFAAVFPMMGWDLEEGGLETHEIFYRVAGFSVCQALVNAISVYFVGSIGDQTGSFLTTLGGSMLGSGVGLASGWKMAGQSDLIMLPIYFLSSIGATVGFNLTRRYDSPPAESETALINVRNGRMSLAVPRVYLQTDSFGRGGLSQNVDLARVRF
jgi:hypothetical protein